MTQVRIDQIGEWYLVIIINGVYEPHSGGFRQVETVFGTFREASDAHDLKQALQRCAAGDLKQTVWSDLPLDEE